MSYLITVENLKNQLRNNPSNTILIDVRFQLNNPDAGRLAYEEGHLPGAFYLDLEKDLSGEVKEHGGNHPLPSLEDFAKTIGNLGIDHETNVVVYDENNEMFAARLWWMLHYAGHDKVFLLEGGFNRWIKEGNPLTKEMPKANQKVFEPKVRKNEVIHIEGVKEKLKKDAAILIDSRSRERYLGKVEPLYKKAGHIPGAKNYFWKAVKKENGDWKSKEELEAHFQNLPKDAEIIVSCGSGVSATPNILSLKIAGYQNVKLYPGSFSDWISYDENEVSTEEE